MRNLLGATQGLLLAATACFAEIGELPARGPYFPFDERIIEDRWQLDRFVVPLQRHPRNPLLVKEHPWEGTGPHAGGTVMRDPGDGRFKMWYGVWDEHAYRNKLPFSYNICYAESRDGLTWHKPQLGLFDYRGSRQNNLIQLGREKTQNIDVELHPAPAGPAQKFIAIHNEKGGVFTSSSADGKSFACSFSSAAVSYHSDTQNNFVYDEERQRWLMFVRPKAYAGAGLQNVGRRRVAVKESRDLQNWTHERTVLTPEEGDPDYFYGMTVFRRGDLFLGVLQLYETTRHLVSAELAWSADGYRWQRLLRGGGTGLLAPGPAGAWDAGMVFLMDKPVEMGDEAWFYYGGSDRPHNVTGTFAVGLATTQRDRFIGVKSRPGQTGRLLTRPFPVNGNLWVNARASGNLRASVHTAEDEPMPGWGATECSPVQGDNLRAEVQWGGKGLQALRGRIVRLRFHFEDAELFSFETR